MTSRLNPYLNFNGNARQALEFYKGVFGGELTLSTFGDMGMADAPDAGKIMHGQLETEAGYTIMAASGPDAELIMHAQLESDAGYTIMGADATSEMPYTQPGGFAVSISGDDADAMHGYWDKLSASGAVTVPLEKQVWGDEFGMCVDQFGIDWLVNISQPQA